MRIEDLAVGAVCILLFALFAWVRVLIGEPEEDRQLAEQRLNQPDDRHRHPDRLRYGP